MADPYWDFSLYSNEPIWLGIRPQGSRMRISDDAIKTVVFLGGIREDGEFVPYGTGFLVAIDTAPSHGFLFLVTAKHVLDDIKASKLIPAARANTKKGAAIAGKISLDNWYTHPTIKNLDLAVSPTRISPEHFDVIHCEVSVAFADDAFIEKFNVGCGDDVFVVGLLTRHTGKERNIPIVRMGNIAGMPNEPVDLGEYGSHYAYLIESRSIGGLSGSPVYVSLPSERFGGPPSSIRSVNLLGVNIGLFQTLAHADKVMGDALDRREAFLETMSAGIAVVLPCQRIREILDHPELVKRREQAMAKKNQNTGFVPTSAVPSRPVEVRVEPATDNPTHKEDFMSLLDAAAKEKPEASQT